MKLTKRSYNRRIYVFGIVMFLSIALMSTGFATWVMSQNANKDGEGNIQVGTITDGSIAFKGDISISDTFRFDPALGDNDGHIVHIAPEQVGEEPVDPKLTAENLKVTISGTVTPKEYFKELTVKIDKDDIPAGVIAAADAGYITLPTCYDNPVVLTEASSEISIQENDVNFSYTVEFGWGSVFGNKNPSLYLDDPSTTNPETGKAYTFEEKEALLVEFRRTMFDLDDTVPAEEVMSYLGTNLVYTISLVATANI